MIPRARPLKDTPAAQGAEAPTVPTSGTAVASLLLGVGSFFLIFLTGIPAIVLGVKGLKEIRRAKGHLRGRSMAAGGIVLGAIGSTAVSTVVLIPVIRAITEASHLNGCSNNLKTIALALHNFEAQYNRLPPAAIINRQGQALLSWRVAILPYLGPEGEALYKKFRLDEPWDSPHNFALIHERPPVFACPTEVGLRGNETTYQAIVGPQTVFTGARKGVRIGEITDGTSTTVLVVEGGKPVPWTAPQDLPFNMNLPFSGAGSRHGNGFFVAMADGSVHCFPWGINGTTFGALVSRAGGEIVSPP